MALIHHIFGDKLGGSQEKLRDQAALRESDRPYVGARPKFRLHDPEAILMVVHDSADTGALIGLWSTTNLHKRGRKAEGRIHVKQRMAAMSRRYTKLPGADIWSEAELYKTTLVTLAILESKDL